MKRFSALVFCLFLSVLPSVCFAELSLAELADVDTSLSVDLLPDMQSDVAYNYVPTPVPGYVTTSPTVVHQYSQPRVVKRTTVVRPKVRPVVVVDQPPTVVVATPPASTVVQAAPQVSVPQIGARLGVGVRGVGLAMGELKTEWNAPIKSGISGGIGLYLKYRPIRWLSVEFATDAVFGKYLSNMDGHFDSSALQEDLEFIRVPVSFGFRVHIFDYGSLDVYGAAAAGISFTTLNDGNDRIDREGRFYQYGGQFGGGVSVLLGMLEFGADVRYTIESSPNEFGLRDQAIELENDFVVHGVIFSLSLGFAI